ncbi:MAG: response regulator, partial [Desulfobulbaceae bacterium]|nr:response regulator [Desulfobulbaceae bacterium]
MRDVSILIVDDTATARNMVRSTLQNHFGTEHIYTAADGKEGLAILRQYRVDIIISDWNMPEMNGEEFLYEVRQNQATKKTPFIMMTSNDNRDFIVTAIQLGVTNYIIKPFTPNELTEKIRAA